MPRSKRLPSDQLVGLAGRYGGFSTKESSGALDRPGAYTSWQDTEQVIEGPVRSTDVMQYRQEHSEELSRPGAYFGGYREPEGVRQASVGREGDTTYLDVSRRFVGPTRVERALEFGRKQGQVSVYDTDAGLSYVHENPDVPDESKYSYSASMAESVRAQKRAREQPPGPERSRHVEEMVDAIYSAQNLKRNP